MNPNTIRKNLVAASILGDLNAVQYLVALSAKKGKPVLNYAVLKASLNNHPVIVRYLIEQSATISTDEGTAGLRYAAQYGYLEVVKCFVENGADITMLNNYVFKAATANGHLELVRYLVEQGVDIHVESDYAFIRAQENGHYDVVDYLESVKSKVAP